MNIRKNIIVLTILALVIGGLFTGCDGSSSTQGEVNPPEVNNESLENTPAPTKNQTPGGIAPSTGAVQGHVAEIQGREIQVGYNLAAPIFGEFECAQELERVLAEGQRYRMVLVDENTVFEIAVIVNEQLSHTEPGTFIDIFIQDAVTVYRQDQGDAILAERIIISDFRW